MLNLVQLLKSFTGHKEAILELLNSNGKYILSGSDDNLAFLWNEYGKIINTISVRLKVNDGFFLPDEVHEND
jgi:WD40 repeat protein